MKELFARIQAASRSDKAANAEQMFLYLSEEVGEVATCISVDVGLKSRPLDEPMESELCDVLIATMGMLARSHGYDYMIETMSNKLQKWERRVSHGSY